MPRTWIKGVSRDTHKPRSRPGRKDYHKRGPGTHRPSRTEGSVICIDGEGRFAGSEMVKPARLFEQDNRVDHRFNLSEIEDGARRAAIDLESFGLLARIPAPSRLNGKGEWDWSRHLGKSERSRLARRYTTPYGDPPDVFAERVARVIGTQVSGGEDIDGCMEEWLRLTRIADAVFPARLNRDLGASFGGCGLADLFERAEQYDGDDLYETHTSQDYFVMVASDASQQFQRTLSVEEGRLSTEQIFEWLVKLPKDASLIGFGLDYDWSMVLADLSITELSEFYDRNSRRYLSKPTNSAKFLPYEWRGWELDQYGSVFKLKQTGAKRWTSIWNVMKLHQKAFIKVLDSWLPELDRGVYDLIVEEKARRGGEEKTLEVQKSYSLAECWTMAEIHTRFRQVLWDHGIKPRSWHGASIAKELQKAYKVDEHHPERTVEMHPDGSSAYRYPEGEPVHGVLDRAAYMGGRFEIGVHGPVERTIYEYDITNAYSHWLRQLPSWHGSHWEHSTSRAKILKHPGWFLAQISWDLPDDLVWGPFGKRFGSDLIFSRSGYRHWVWSPEIRVAQLVCPQAFTVHEAYMLHVENEVRPFAYLEELFELRQELEREQKGRGDPFKVGMNSTYGSLAEQTTDTPNWQCLAWAGMTSSGCRSQVAGAIYDGNLIDTLAVATDAIYTLAPRPDLVAGGPKRLGEWEEVVHPDGWFFAQSGILLPLKDGKLKSRGIPARNLLKALPDFLEAWEEAGINSSCRVGVHHFYGGKINTVRPRYRNKWVDEWREISFKAAPKRRDPFLHEGIMRSYPAHVGKLSAQDVIGYMPDDNEDGLTQNVVDKLLAGVQDDWGR